MWWDAEIPPGETWDEVIERELTAAKAVVVLWSEAAVKKRWVKTEASLALDANKLLPALIDQALPPIAFRPIQAASLADWRGEAEHEGFAQLLASIERLAGAPGAAAARRARRVPGAGPVPSEAARHAADVRAATDRPGRRGCRSSSAAAGAVGAAAIAASSSSAAIARQGGPPAPTKTPAVSPPSPPPPTRPGDRLPPTNRPSPTRRRSPAAIRRPRSGR